MSMDFYPTLLHLAGVKVDHPVDGLDLAPLWGQAHSEPAPIETRDALFWHYPHYWAGKTVTPFSVVRQGNWKLIHFYEDDRQELYNLKDDPSERKDLAKANPGQAQELAPGSTHGSKKSRRRSRCRRKLDCFPRRHSPAISASFHMDLGWAVKGRHKRSTWSRMPRCWKRGRQSASLSLEMMKAWPAATGKPANGPPCCMRAKSSDTRVVLPDFHWLVSRESRGERAGDKQGSF